MAFPTARTAGTIQVAGRVARGDGVKEQRVTVSSPPEEYLDLTCAERLVQVLLPLMRQLSVETEAAGGTAPSPTHGADVAVASHRSDHDVIRHPAAVRAIGHSPRDVDDGDRRR